MYTSFVLQCTVSGRYCKHKTDVEAWHGIHLSHKRSMKYSGHWKLLCELSKFSKFNTPRILNEHWCIYSCVQIPPIKNWFQYVRREYANAITFPCIKTLLMRKIGFGWWKYSLVKVLSTLSPLRKLYWFSLFSCLGRDVFTRSSSRGCWLVDWLIN